MRCAVLVVLSFSADNSSSPRYSSALLGFVYTVINFLRHGVGIERLLKKACDLLTIVIPPALPAAMSIGTSFAINRLKRSQIYCISPPRVNVCGKLNAIVFDKTGTLTEDGLDVLGVVPIDAASERYKVGECSSLWNHILPAQHNTSFGAMISDIDVLMKFTSAEAPSLPSKSTTLLDALATCHSLNHVRGELVGDPMDLKMFAWTRWSLEEPKVTGDQLATIVHPPRKEPITHECLLQPTGEFEFNASADPLAMDSDELGIIRTFEFVSGLRRMSAIVKRLGENRMHAVVKGAPEVMHDICDPSTLPADYDAVLDYYTRRGYRVLACGTKSLENLSWRHAQKIPRENVESDLRFLGLVVFENKLKRETAPVLGVLQRANIRTLMCTGDNVLTAISVSKECGLVAPHSAVFMPRIHHDPMESLGVKRKRVVWESLDDPTWGLDPHLLVPSMSATAISGTSSKTNSFTRFNEINLSSKLFRTGAPDGAAAAIVDMSAAVTTDPTHNYDLAITGEVFDHLIQHASASTLNRALVKAKVFARMSPEQKLELVERLQDLGYCVSMCGDGANDCAALKSSDAGISLSNAEASVAAPFTSHKQDIECVLEVIRQGRAALVTSFSCFKYMGMLTVALSRVDKSHNLPRLSPALYSMIQFGSVTLLYSVMANLGDFQVCTGNECRLCARLLFFPAVPFHRPFPDPSACHHDGSS